MVKTIAQAVVLAALQMALLVGLVACVALHILGVTA